MNELGDTWEFRSILRTTLPVLVALSLLEVGAGYVLEDLKTTFTAHPELLVLIPVMIGVGGTLGSILASRLSTAFHLGTAETAFDPPVLSNVGATLGLAVTTSLVVAAATHGIGSVAVGVTVPFPTLLLITVVSGLLIAVFVIVVSISVTVAAFRFGVDPDDVAIPAVTNLCDVAGVLILVGVIGVVL